MKDASKKFVIIDGNAIIHRAYHAVPPLTAKDGTIVNAVYGFTSMLLKVVSDIKPDYLAVSFDLAGPTFRDEIYSEYKATRVKADQDLYDQIPLVHDMVRAFGIPIYVKEGFEADDVMGTITSYLKKDGAINRAATGDGVVTPKSASPEIVSIIVTGDRDMLQLVDDDITEVYLLKKGITDVELYNEAKVFERFGFGPELIVEFKALRGDSSDNIPGVKGIGDKTAQMLIEKFNTIDDMYRLLEDTSSALYTECSASVIKKLEEGKDNAYMSRKLGTIHVDVPDLAFNLDACDIARLNWDVAASEIKKFEFFSLLKRLPGYKAAPAPEQKKKSIARPKLSVTVIKNKTELEALKKKILEEKIYTCKESIIGDSVMNGEWSGISLIVGNEGYYIDVPSLEKDIVLFFKAIAEQTGIALHGHDLKPLIKLFLLHDITIKNEIFDCMIASYVLNSSSRTHDLPAIVLREFGIEESVSTDQANLFGEDPARVLKVLQYLPELVVKYTKRLKDDNQKDLFENIEMKLIPVLSQMEVCGVAIDTKMLGIMSEEAAKEIASLTTNIYKEAGKEFNIASSVQLRDILFDILQLPTQGIKKGKTGYSTAAPELEKLRLYHPIITLIEEYREVEKLRNTYIDVLPNLINKKTGRIHTTYNQAVAATGRLSSSDPNLQNIPIRSELGKKIRDAFVAEKGNVLVAADYSQIELRIVAALAKDTKLTDIFKRGEDVHAATAALIHDIPLKDVTKEIRRTAKEVNFGVLYGMGPFGLASRTGISQAEARTFIKNYFNEFSGVKNYLDEIVEKAKVDGYVETLFGRRRYIPDIQAKNIQLRNAAERMAINMPVQGTAADMMKIAMIAVQEHINKKYRADQVRMIMQVHDELVLEVAAGPGLQETVAAEVKKIMEDVVKLNVPIVVEAHTGERWGELK